MIPLLLANGAALEAQTPESLSRTPLHQAVCSLSDSSDTVEQLLLAGADKEARSQYSWQTPLQLAVKSNNKACVTHLLKSGVNIDASDTDGYTSLHDAARRGQLEIVEALLDHGANPTIKTSRLLGPKPSGVATDSDVPTARKEKIRTLLKEAEKAWKRSGGK
ncbi:hypothetical protein HO173_000600 [Letharia columbiana]|uniref:Uncharacterized protein n=1 Tax=Letharia columbiana TaxID=112416 RepID=A0A8H6LAK4_9LECA|nr:uncharacterized protein HO173_000600 [Letharia columbiana]KAF6241888.1 hypothetical protein HO173_000600 [Letharia columbiana]